MSDATEALRFRKKPVVIEAFQMTHERRADNRDWPEWLNRAWNAKWPEVGAVSCVDWPTSDGTDRLLIATLEGAMTVGWDDWIIRGVKGELYACKPEIFAMTYEPESRASRPNGAERDALRYRWLRAQVSGVRMAGAGSKQAFAFPSHFGLPPVTDIMRGSVAQHLDAAIDAALTP